ncbi:MAG: MoaD/ThiS family protein [Rhodospirillales bacterium]
MTRVVFTSNLQRHLACPEVEATGRTVREVMEHVFAAHPQVRSYVLDDQSALRRHMVVFVDGEIVGDRTGLTDPVAEASTVYVFQALSGGRR